MNDTQRPLVVTVQMTAISYVTASAALVGGGGVLAI
jgi:hypothetical protein